MTEQRAAVRTLVAEGTALGVALATAGLAKSTWCYRPRPRRPRPLDPALVAGLQQVTGYELTYGYRRLTPYLKRRGLTVNGKKVLRHARALGMLQPRKRKGPRFTVLTPVHPTVANTYWEGDSSQVDTAEGRTWCCAIVDPAQGSRPAGGEVHDRCRAREAVAVLETSVLSAFPREGRVPDGQRLVLRVDRGGQFTARLFREAAIRLGVTLEYCGVRCPNDKPYVEGFFSRYKVEEVYRADYRTLEEARTGWAQWTRWYATERLHSRLGYRPPDDVRAGLAQTAA